MFLLALALASAILPHSAQAEEMQVVEIVGQRPIFDPGMLDYLDLIRNRERYDWVERSTGGGARVVAAPPSDSNSNHGEIGCNKSKTGAPNGASPVIGNPVVVATGEKLLFERDFQAMGDYGLGLARTYRSQNASGTLFGPYWLSSIDYPRLNIVTANCYRLQVGGCIPRTVIVTDPDGVKQSYGLQLFHDERFRLYDYTVRKSQSAGTLTHRANGEWLLTRDKTLYAYSNDGYLQRIVDSFGAVLSFGYQGNRLITVTSAAGKTLALGYGGNGLVATVRDPAGSIWTYDYDGNNMLAKVTAPGAAGQQDIREYTYGGPDNPASTDPTLVTGIVINGVPFSNYTYHPDRRAKDSGPASGEEKETFNYGANLTNVTDLRGQSTDYTFINVLGEMKIDTISRAPSATCSSASAKTVYDANGYIDYQLDWEGSKTDYTFDEFGRLTDVTTAAGTSDALATIYTWEGDDIKTTEWRGTNGIAYLRVTYTYEGSQLKSEVWDDLKTGNRREIIYTYTRHPSNILAARTASRWLPEGYVTDTLEFNTSGNLVRHVNPLGYAESWANHNSMGQPGRHTTFKNRVEEFGYHVNGNLTQHALLLAGGKRFTKFSYNHDRQVMDVSHASGRIDRYRYNVSGRLDRTGDAAGNYATTVFDAPSNTMTWSAERHVPAAGNVPLAKSEGRFSKVTVFDSLGRPYTVLGNHGQRTDFRYDLNGNLATQTDALGRSTTFEYDAQDRPVRRVAPDGGVSRWEYDNEGRLHYFYDPRGIRTDYTYTGFGDVATVNSPDGGNVSYGYDAAGRLKSETRAGEAIVYTLDALERLRTRSRGGVTETYAYDPMGKLERFTDATGSTDFGYNDAEELVGKVSNVYGGIHTTAWAYDVAGRLIGMGYDGSQLSLGFDYNTVGQLTRIRTSKGGTWGVLASQFLYQPATGRRYGWRFNNSIPRLDTLDTDGRIEKIYSINAVNQTYGYDATDTLNRITDAAYPTLSENMGYDANDRLGYSGPAANVQAYVWDQSGNRGVHRNFGIEYHSVISPTSNRLDLLHTLDNRQWRSFEYDALGNLFRETANSGTRTYSYDAFFRMNGAQVGANQAAYYNNALNQRAVKVANGSVTHYQYGPDGELVAEYIGSSRTYYIWLGGELLAIERDGTIYASHNDRTGRPVVLLDATTKKVWRAANTAFDRKVETSTIGDMNIGYPGQYYDKETGLWYNWHRYYDASLGRYIQSDPVGLLEGSSLYSYVDGNPLSYTDRLGLCPACVPFLALLDVGLTLNALATGDGPGASPASSPIRNAVALGRQGEASVCSAFDIGVRRTIKVNGRRRIPDGISEDAVNEVKNVAKLSFSRQLRDYSDFAKDNALKFNLYTRQGTNLSAPLQNAVDIGLINRLLIP